MKNYIMNVRVNEDVVKEVSGEDDLESAIKLEAGWMHDSGIYLESINEVSEKCILVSTGRMDLNITTETFSSRKAAHDEMLKQIFDQSDYKSVEELVEAADAGEAGYSDDEAWIKHSSSDTIVWKIITM